MRALDGSRVRSRTHILLVLPKAVGKRENTYLVEADRAEAFNKYDTRSEAYSERREERRAYRRIRDRVKAELFTDRENSHIEKGRVIRVLVGDDSGKPEWFDGVITNVDSSCGNYHCRIDWINGDDPEWIVLEREKWEFVDTPKRTECDCPFTLEEVQFALRTMSLSKAGGCDDIPMQCLKYLPSPTINRFVNISNKTWEGEDLPIQWRTSRLCPIPKPKPGAFRPIALTNAFGRLADKLATRRTSHFLDTFAEGIQTEQSGFRRGLSAEQQARAFTQYLEDEVQREWY